ncbi:MAG: MFS transporter [Acidimicrobiia bacterium]|nr:MFS transporter [Acidimicrobiia bacterium]
MGTAVLTRSAFGFAAFGVVWSAWTVAAPEVQADFGFDDSALGALVTALNVVALVLLGLAARTSSRLGSFRTVRMGLLGLAACWAVAGVIAPAAVFVVLIVVGGGCGSGFVEVSLNAAGIDLDRRAGRPVLGYLHAAFPAGSLLFLLVGSLAVQLGGGRFTVFALAAALVAAMCLVWPAYDHADEASFGGGRHGRVRAMRRHPRLVLLSALAGAGLYSEVAVGTWSVVYLRDDLDASPLLAGAAAASFAVSMLTARLVLPSLLRRTSPLRVALACASGLLGAGLLLLAFPYVGAASLAFGLIGFAAGPLVPIAMQLGGTVLPRDLDTAAAAVNTLGYVGLIAAPWLVGWLGDAASLRAGLATITAAGGVTLLATVLLARVGTDRPPIP